MSRNNSPRQAAHQSARKRRTFWSLVRTKSDSELDDLRRELLGLNSWIGGRAEAPERCLTIAQSAQRDSPRSQACFHTAERFILVVVRRYSECEQRPF